MKTRILIKLLCFLVLFACSSCSTFSFFSSDDDVKPIAAAPIPAPKAAEPAVPKDTITTETIGGMIGEGQGAVTGGSLLRIRTTSHITFTGTVTGIDLIRKTISVKSTGKNMTFDLTNPVLRGYPNVSAIKTGDTISLGYIKNGIGIAKGESFPEDLRHQTAADETVNLKSKGKRSKKNNTKQSNRAAPVRVKYRAHSTSFKDVDNNKDGRISPVELNTVIYGLTMEDFRKYDRNGDGGLDEAEYRSVKKR